MEKTKLSKSRLGKAGRQTGGLLGLRSVACLLAVTASALLFSACPPPEGEDHGLVFTVDFDINWWDDLGRREIPSQEIRYGGKVTEPDPPAITGYTFARWYYRQPGYSSPLHDRLWEFNQYKVYGNYTLYARWIENIDSLPAPAGLSARALSSSAISLSWNDVRGSELYYVYRRDASSTSEIYTKVGSIRRASSDNLVGVPLTTHTTYIDTGLNANTTYYYKVSAVSPGGAEGEKSLEVSATIY